MYAVIGQKPFTITLGPNKKYIVGLHDPGFKILKKKSINVHSVNVA